MKKKISSEGIPMGEIRYTEIGYKEKLSILHLIPYTLFLIPFLGKHCHPPSIRGESLENSYTIK